MQQTEANASVTPPAASPAPAVETRGLRKAFGATVAVDGVSFAIEGGHVHALLGENGAGKSTVVKLLAGLIAPDEGGIDVFGTPASINSPRRAHALGIQTAFQEMTLVRDMTVLDNMLMPYAPLGPGALIRRRSAEAEIAAHFEGLSLAGIDLNDEIRELDLPERQKIEIARALYRRPKILLL